MVNEQAVSEVIGAIILIAILAMVAAVVIVALETGPTGDVKEPAIILNSLYRIEDDLLVLSHDGGDLLEKADMVIRVDGVDHTDDFSTSSTNPGLTGWTTFKAGEKLYYTPPGSAIPLGVQVVGINPDYGDILIYSSGDIIPFQTMTTATPVPTGTATPTPTPTTPPVVNFTANTFQGQAPLTVQFTDNTSNSPTSWLWNFGDNTSSTTQHPLHKYWYAGNYTVSLFADNGGGNDTLTKTDYITVLPYVIRVNTGGPQYTDGNGNIWLADQAYDGSWGFNTSTGFWTNSSPISGTDDDILYQSENFFNGNMEYNFSNVPDGIYNVTLKFAEIYSGTFGDGLRVFDLQVENATPQVTGFDIYSLVGPSAAYDISFNVTVADGELNVIFPQHVENPKISAIEISTQWYNGTQPTPPPVADFTSNVTNGTAPLVVQFNDTSTNLPTVWFWDFGDGANSTVQHPLHIFSVAGLYNVSLTAENVYGNDTETKTGYINVTQAGGGAGNLILNTITRSGIFKEGSTLTFRSDASGANNRKIVFNGATTYDIGRYNDVVLVINSDQIGTIAATSTSQSPPLRITTLEFSDVSIYDGGILQGTGSIALTAGNDRLSRITITESALTLAVPYQVNPTSSLTVDGVSVATGNSGIILYNITNDVDDDMDVTIVPATPSTYAKVAVGSYELYSLNPGFTANVTSGNAPLAVAFTDTSTGSVISRSWDFGGLGSSTATNPEFVFTSGGNYTVNLSVTGPAGEVINASQIISVVGTTPTPVGYWRFEDVTGALAVDSSANGNDGSILGTYLQVPGASGNGLYFDGTGTYVSVPDDSTLDFTTEMTLTAWVYPVEKTTGDVYNRYMHMIAGKGADGSENFDFSMAPVALPSGGGDYTGKSFWFESQGGSLIAKGPSDGWPVVPPNQWSMLSLVIDGSTLTYYLDGTPYATTVTSPLIPNSNPLWLGRQNAGSYPLSFKGIMDEVSLYGEALSQAEISDLYSSVSPATYPPVAAFSANVTSGTAPLGVLFTDATTNSPTLWAWTFGDGGNSTDQNPVHTYNSAGIYTVVLTATNVYGSDAEMKTAYITVGPTIYDVILNGRTYKLKTDSKFGFDVTGSNSYVEYEDKGTKTEPLPVGSTIEIKLRNDKSGSIGTTSTTIHTMALDKADVRVDETLKVDNKKIKGIWVSGYDSFTSDVVLTAKKSNKEVSFTVDGSLIVSGKNKPDIILNDIQPDSNGIMNLNGDTYVLCGVTSYSTI